MNKKRYIYIILLIMLTLNSCSTVKNTTTTVSSDNAMDVSYSFQSEADVERTRNVIETTKVYKLYESEHLYYCDFYNQDNMVIKTEGPFSKLPKLFSINDDSVLLSMQAGTGKGAQWGYFYNYQTESFSETFTCIYDQTDDLVATGSVGKVIIQSIFENEYYQEIKDFEYRFSEVAEPIISASFSSIGNSISVTYLKGQDYTEVTENFDLINQGKSWDGSLIDVNQGTGS